MSRPIKVRVPDDLDRAIRRFAVATGKTYTYTLIEGARHILAEYESGAIDARDEVAALRRQLAEVRRIVQVERPQDAPTKE